MALSTRLHIQVCIIWILVPLPLISVLADYIKSVVSVVTASLSTPSVVTRIMWPCIFLLATFGSFVLWNGGVVLGMLCPY